MLKNKPYYLLIIYPFSLSTSVLGQLEKPYHSESLEHLQKVLLPRSTTRSRIFTNRDWAENKGGHGETRPAELHHQHHPERASQEDQVESAWPLMVQPQKSHNITTTIFCGLELSQACLDSRGGNVDFISQWEESQRILSYVLKPSQWAYWPLSSLLSSSHYLFLKPQYKFWKGSNIGHGCKIFKLWREWLLL